MKQRSWFTAPPCRRRDRRWAAPFVMLRRPPRPVQADRWRHGRGKAGSPPPSQRTPGGRCWRRRGMAGAVSAVAMNNTGPHFAGTGQDFFLMDCEYLRSAARAPATCAADGDGPGVPPPWHLKVGRPGMITAELLRNRHSDLVAGPIRGESVPPVRIVSGILIAEEAETQRSQRVPTNPRAPAGWSNSLPGHTLRETSPNRLPGGISRFFSAASACLRFLYD
jgi:hypothetical protein